MEKETKAININITPESIFQGIGLILLIWFLYFIKDLVLVVLVAVVIASGMEPLISWFNKYKISRLPASIISYLGIFGVFAGLIFFFVPPVLDEAASLLTELPKYLESTTLWNPLNINSESVSVSQKVVSTLSDSINNPSQLVRDAQSQIKTNIPSTNFGLGDLVQSLQEISSNVSNGFIKIVSSIFGGLLSFILIVVLSFYLLVQEDGVANFLRLVTPMKYEKYIVDLWKRSQRKIGQWMQGQFLLGIIVGVLVYLGLMILGVKNALLFAVLAGCLEIIPVFGPILSAIPAILMAFVSGGFTSAILVLGLYIIIQQFENHLIYPLVVKKVVGVSPVIVILALLSEQN
ncbi:MAG: AI-2E family transporter [Candidatus Paceibacterota bacterium]|jgi:predicted PurR-regulated permease PerM